MNWIAELLPLFFVRWYSQHYLERRYIDGRLMALPRPGVYVEVVEYLQGP